MKDAHAIDSITKIRRINDYIQRSGAVLKLDDKQISGITANRRCIFGDGTNSRLSDEQLETLFKHTFGF